MLRLTCATAVVALLLGGAAVAQGTAHTVLTKDVVEKTLPHTQGDTPPAAGELPTNADGQDQRSDLARDDAKDGPDAGDAIGLIQARKEPASQAADQAQDQPEDGLRMQASPQMLAADIAGQVTGPLIHPPVVVELFTSQGCSSCPMADDLMAYLAERPDVLALSWHVDYWDYLGWTDEFARPEFTRRQKAYAAAAGERSIYTPQIVVSGSETLIQIRPATLMALIDSRMAQPVSLSVTATGTKEAYQIELTPRAKPEREIAILLVRYAPERVVSIDSGENGGLTLTYRNVVLGVERVASWDGRAPLRLNVTASAAGNNAYPADTKHAILAQQVGAKGRATGAILAAVRLD